MSHYSDIRDRHDDELARKEYKEQLAVLTKTVEGVKDILLNFRAYRLENHYRTSATFRKLSDSLVHAEHAKNNLEKLLGDA
jgi:hypothetical protein